MKLTLTFLVCLVGVTFSQYAYPQYGYPHFGGYYGPRLAQLNPFYYPQYPVQQPYGDYAHHQEGAVQARTPSKNEFEVPEARFFGLLSSIRSSLITTLTSSSFATVTSTATVASLATCIPSTLFATGTSSTPCRRRKRSIFNSPLKIVDDNDDSDSDLVKREVADYQPSIASAIESNTSRNGRLFLVNTFVSTTSGTVTSFIFTTSVIKTTIAPGGAGSLSCLPSGITVC